MRQLTFLTSMLALFVATPAQAYIGPGVGAGTIVVILGVIASIFMAFVAILWYPAKRLFKRRKPKKQGGKSS